MRRGDTTTDWVPREEFRPHAQESAEAQRPSHRLRNVERHRQRRATVAAANPLYAHAQPSDAQLSDAQPSDAKPSRLRETSPAYVVPTWYAPFIQAHYAETRAADRAARYAARANRANAPPQQHHIAQGIALDN
jgi:hypothetical protein